MVKRFCILFLLLVPTVCTAYDATSSCVRCHSDFSKMMELGAPALYLDPQKVDEEVSMGGIPTCVDCHQGDNIAMEKESAHQGLLKPFLMAVGGAYTGQAMARTEIGITPLEPSGQHPFDAMLPKPERAALQQAKAGKIVGLYYHDRDPLTFAYAPEIARATCGKCHDNEVTAYNNSTKGLLKHQRAFRTFTEDLPGPQNCGPWFGDNHAALSAECAVPFSDAQNNASARQCSKCHTGCTDCHYQAYKGKGSHRFGTPEAPSCYGGGRASLCHAGPMDRRRGAGYMRGEYAFPSDLPVDVHAQLGVNCTDCHQIENHQFGHLASDSVRNSCQQCHKEIMAAMAESTHSNVDCSACHIQTVGAYQFTFWGPGVVAGVETPFTKHKEYYGTRSLPTLIKNAAGRWIPVKPYPMAALNQAKDVAPTGLKFRAIPQRTIKGDTRIGEPETFTIAREQTDVNDAFIVTGTRDDLPHNNKALLWIQMDKMSHALGAARSCASCHTSHAQVAESNFTYANDKDVEQPFTGSYTIIADAEGMRFENLKTSLITPVAKRHIADFAPFTYFPDGWNVTGIDFSIPFRAQEVSKVTTELEQFITELNEVQDLEVKTIRAVAYHNLERAKEMLANKKESLRAPVVREDRGEHSE
ncbi:MAG: cytochrome c3 family protein [Desulfuromonadaceae bacterium]|nr:cytochrome c3 family protein [Desulfuromonadaceae bacterium]